MRPVVVVSRNPAIAIGLQRFSEDVVGLRPDGARPWREEAAASSAVVLDLGSPEVAGEAVALLRGDGVGIPIVLIGGPQAGWEELAGSGGGAMALVPLPLSLTVLTSELERLLGDAVAAPVEPPTDPELKREPEPAKPSTPAKDHVSTVVPTTVPPWRNIDPLTAPIAAMPPTAAPVASAAPEHPSTPRGLGTTASLVDRLLPVTSELTHLSDAADAVTDEAVERTGAEAGVLLMPDGLEWRVEGARGLRPLEERLRLTDDHWLVSTVITDRKGILIVDSDITRERMRNAPLASRRHLLALPFPHVAALLLLAREDDPFLEEHLTLLLELAAEGEELLVEGLQLRALARALSPFTDFD